MDDSTGSNASGDTRCAQFVLTKSRFWRSSSGRTREMLHPERRRTSSWHTSGHIPARSRSTRVRRAGIRDGSCRVRPRSRSQAPSPPTRRRRRSRPLRQRALSSLRQCNCARDRGPCGVHDERITVDPDLVHRAKQRMRHVVRRTLRKLRLRDGCSRRFSPTGPAPDLSSDQ